MDKLITVVNELHEAFSDIKTEVKLNLPQIAVVGSQSSGKSSVLENVVGRDFLPRGSGIVTRCPLVLQLIQLPKTSTEEWGEFQHKPGVKITDFKEIRHEIERRTVEIAGNASVTDKPIMLKIYSPKVLTLTLVDLPGLVMNAVGDQPRDIDKQIKEMVTRYVKPANTIILAVSPANADMATSSALNLAQKVDPEGNRTIGVMTKLDLMDRGTNARDILDGKVIPLKRGFIGVVNRSQEDINMEKGIDAARASEREFFENHPAYRDIADRQGTEYLSKALNAFLLDHIQAVLPELKAHVDKLMTNTRKTMEKLGMFDEQAIERGAHVLSLIKQFSDNINQAIDGGATDATKELMGGARIDYIFNDSFGKYVTSLSAEKDLTDEYIRVNIRNISGMNASLFPSDQVLFALARQQVQRLEEPSLKCVNYVHDELMKIVEYCSARVERYPVLRKRMIGICQDLLAAYRNPTQTHVRTLIAAERGFINVRHPVMQQLALDAIKKMQHNSIAQQQQQVVDQQRPTAGAGQQQQLTPQQQQQQQQREQQQRELQAQQQREQQQLAQQQAAARRPQAMNDIPSKIMLGSEMNENEKSQNNAIREMVEGYFSIVQRTISDQVPKAINLLMIMKLRDEVYAKLVRELYKENLYEELLAEAPDIVAQRKGARTMMNCLEKANEALSKVRDYAPASPRDHK